MPRVLLDDTDRRIITHLQEDGRRPYTTIAADLGLSEASIRQRVARLVQRKVIQIVAASNPLDLGLQRTELGITVIDTSPMQLAERIAAFPEVDFVAICAGSFDIVAGVVFRDREELFDVLVNKVRGLSGVARVDVFQHLRVLKDTYEWPPPDVT
jgi:Lrp/AsnC family transcriptional regulator for asnA, asnC and gidA